MRRSKFYFILANILQLNVILCLMGCNNNSTKRVSYRKEVVYDPKFYFSSDYENKKRMRIVFDVKQDDFKKFNESNLFFISYDTLYQTNIIPIKSYKSFKGNELVFEFLNTCKDTSLYDYFAQRNCFINDFKILIKLDTSYTDLELNPGIETKYLIGEHIIDLRRDSTFIDSIELCCYSKFSPPRPPQFPPTSR